jgi:glycolate oxidase iron-sulfur subunit
VKTKRAELLNLIRMMKALEQRVAQCTRCGMCQAVCPLYASSGHEKDVARGKLMLLDGLMKELFENPEGVSERLNHCLLCGSCEAECPRNVSTLEIFLTARAIISEYKGLSPAKKILFRKIMANPDLFNRLVEWGSKFQRVFIRPTKITTDSSCSQLFSPVLSQRRMVPLASTPFHKMNITSDAADVYGNVKVAFFVGCLLDKVFPEVAKVLVEVLKHHDMRVFIPQPQGCCGIPLLSGGDRETFNRLVKYHVELFDAGGFDYLVTGCATCTATIKKLWPTMAEIKTSQGKEIVDRLAEKTYDISAFLVNIVGVSSQSGKRIDKDIKKIVTYHDPCHLRKTLKIYQEPRILIDKKSKYIFKEMPEADACCGMGGSFNLSYYGTSTDIGLKKIVNIKASGASIVATGCPACMMQLKDMLAKTNTQISVKHVIELYSDE